MEQRKYSAESGMVNSSGPLPGMLIIESIANAKKQGFPMRVCGDAAVPDGFVVSSFLKTPGKCYVLGTAPRLFFSQ